MCVKACETFRARVAVFVLTLSNFMAHFFPAPFTKATNYSGSEHVKEKNKTKQKRDERKKF